MCVKISARISYQAVTGNQLWLAYLMVIFQIPSLISGHHSMRAWARYLPVWEWSPGSCTRPQTPRVGSEDSAQWCPPSLAPHRGIQLSCNLLYKMSHEYQPNTHNSWFKQKQDIIYRVWLFLLNFPIFFNISIM